MKMQELKNKPTGELKKQLTELRAQEAQLQFAVRAGEERNVRKLRTCKRDIARLLTRLRALDA